MPLLTGPAVYAVDDRVPRLACPAQQCLRLGLNVCSVGKQPGCNPGAECHEDSICSDGRRAGGGDGLRRLGCVAQRARAAAAEPDIFAAENLVAWCIVPFDAKNAGPKSGL